jgi:hypothetical protein
LSIPTCCGKHFKTRSGYLGHRQFRHQDHSGPGQAAVTRSIEVRREVARELAQEGKSLNEQLSDLVQILAGVREVVDEFNEVKTHWGGTHDVRGGPTRANGVPPGAITSSPPRPAAMSIGEESPRRHMLIGGPK